MRPRRAVAALSLAASAAAGCGAGDPGPLARIVTATPVGAVAPDAVEVQLAFSAPVDARGIADGRFFALCRRDDLRDVVLAAEAADGLGAGAPVVASRIEVASDGRTARLRPLAALEPDARWAAVLSYRARSASGRPILDPNGHGKTFALLFETGAAPDRTPPRPRWLVPPHGPVPRNVAAIRIGFDEPVAGALALPGAAARADEPASDALGLELDGPLPPGDLAPSLEGVRDLAGNPAAAIEPLAVSRCDATAAPAIGGATVTPGDLSLAFDAALAGLGRLTVELSAAAGQPACGVAPPAPLTAVVAGEFLPCPGYDPCLPAAAVCRGRVEVHGLCPGRTVRARLASEDLAAHRAAATAWIDAASLPPRPAPVLTEALADADAPEAGGEYVEVANLGTGDADLSGFALAKRGASGAFTRCTLAPAGAAAVAPGGHALLVGGAYDGRYPLPAGTPIYHCGAAALAGGLANDRALALALEDALGQVVSTMGIAEAAPRCPQGALERIHPAGADAAANWACPGARTPGACNRSTPPEECPRRPW